MGLEKRYAIIIGSNNYSVKKLRYPIKDAIDVSKLLEERCKFLPENIHLIISEFEKPVDIKEKITEATKKIKAEGFIANMHTLLFYFSGHGVYDKTQDESFIELSDTENLSVNNIYSLIKKLGGKNNYVIVDACYSGGKIDLFSTKSKVERKLHYSSNGIYCLFGATSNSIALEPTDIQTLSFGIKNGILTHYLINVIHDDSKYLRIGNSKTGILPFKCIDGYVSILTQIQSNFVQIPVTYLGSEGNHPFGIVELKEKEKKFQISEELKSQICTIFFAKRLKFFGFPQNSLFYYDENGQIFSSLEMKIKEGAFFSAYTVAELGKFLPAELEINERTLIAHKRQGNTYPLKDGWRFPNAKELRFPFAQFHGHKAELGDRTEYIVTYRVSRCSIGHKTKDSYQSLIFFDENEADVRAQLLLELIRYQYIDNKKSA